MSDVRVRREPPVFRRVTVRRTELLGPRMARITVAGDELAGLVVPDPAASVRLLVPESGAELVMPTWERNVFLLPDGRRAPIRTLTPRRNDEAARELDLDIVLHGRGVVSRWAEHAAPGDEAAVSGPARGYTIDPHASAYVLAGDESAVPAISQLLEALPPGLSIAVHVEVAEPQGRVPLPVHPGAEVAWHDLPAGDQPGSALVAAVLGSPFGSGTKVWVAGEAAAVQRIRRHLFEERGLTRADATVRGYWKHGRAGDDDGVE
jgi:NADPH-dependent ferric siderophore reductase